MAVVAALEVGELLGRRRPAPADVGVVRLDVVGRGAACRRPSRARRYGRPRPLRHPCACTSSTRRREHVGVGLGQHAVAEVEDVARAGRRCAAARRAAGRPRPSHGARHTAGSRLPCTATPVGQTRRRAASSGTRQSTPTTSAPAVAQQRRAARPCPRRSGCGARRGRRGPRRPCALAGSTSRGSRPGESAPAQLSNSWTACAPGVHLGAQRGEATMSASRSSSSRHERGLAVHERLGARVGPRRAALDEVAGHGERARRRSRSAARRARRRAGAPSRRRRACRPRARTGAAASRSAAVRNGWSTTGPTPGSQLDAEADGGDGARRCRRTGWRRRRRSAAPAAG